MSRDVAVVLDASALVSYVEGRVAVGELMAEVADEGRQVAVPAACLAAAYAATSSEVGAALIALLMTAPVVRVLPLSGDDARETGTLARSVGGDIALGHAARAALAHEAHVATARPADAAAVLPEKWSILALD
ncbi:hypothetical protein ACVCAH_22345 [Micromonospora sp. LZ34]